MEFSKLHKIAEYFNFCFFNILLFFCIVSKFEDHEEKTFLCGNFFFPSCFVYVPPEKREPATEVKIKLTIQWIDFSMKNSLMEMFAVLLI